MSPYPRAALAQRAFRFLDILEGQLAAFDEMRHQRSGLTAKQSEEVLDQMPVSGLTGRDCLEDVGIADFLAASHGFLAFQAMGDPSGRSYTRGRSFDGKLCCSSTVRLDAGPLFRRGPP